MLGKQGYRHTLRMCNTNCFSSAAVVARKRHIVACLAVALTVSSIFYELHGSCLQRLSFSSYVYVRAEE